MTEKPAAAKSAAKKTRGPAKKTTRTGPVGLGPTRVTVTGTFVKLDGTPCTGVVTFNLRSRLGQPGQITETGSIVATLDVNGSFSVSLPATDDAATVPQGVTYVVHEKIDGAGDRAYDLALPHGSGPIDLGTVEAVSGVVAPSSAYVLLSSIGAANGVASLNGSSRVVQNPAPPVTLQAPADATTPFTIKRFSPSQSADLFQIQDEASGAMAKFNQKGSLRLNQPTTVNTPEMPVSILGTISALGPALHMSTQTGGGAWFNTGITPSGFIYTNGFIGASGTSFNNPWTVPQNSPDPCMIFSIADVQTSYVSYVGGDHFHYWNGVPGAEANPRIIMDAVGNLKWGPGSAVADTFFGRSAAGQLQASATGCAFVIASTDTIDYASLTLKTNGSQVLAFLGSPNGISGGYVAGRNATFLRLYEDGAQKARMAFGGTDDGTYVVGVYSNAVGTPTFGVKRIAAQTADLLRITDEANAVLSRIGSGGRYITKVGTAPALGDLVDGELAFWTDPATGNLKVTSRIAGALKNATVAVA